ncbi:uncharacterized protein J7T54_006625 [Emericellopsis cladophorae]|uniref:Uncharacterized protein n=1 Tax=Emericellopsis cladophorae TaxID=2686198 RepID=A0A9Q0BHC2_9HYPO|nr:uncharacterized protein J7T54_006625 [Emericellopsis cladophorae]KAI6784580.1 hypothetical protein J7T54_006625 [Emericellopsis cladophorae]
MPPQPPDHFVNGASMVFRMPDPTSFQRATQSRSPLDTSTLPSGDRKLAIILPVDRPSPDLCNKDTAGYDQLDDEDIVVMLDALDVWFQLPPEVLLTRYFMALQEADQRLQNEHNMTAEDSIYHTIMELAGDQGVFEEVFGDKNPKTKELHKEYEYHVGLDYRQELFCPTCYSEENGFFVELGNPEAVELESHRVGVSPPRVAGLPADIAVANSPLLTLELATSDQPSWGQLAL